MASKIEDYGLIGNTITCALVSRSGSIDWFCAPRFDSDACFTALVGYDEHGRWSLRPTARVRETRQRYRDDTMMLETEFVCDGGVVRIVDFMPMDGRCSVVRVIEGVDGEVPVEMLLDVRFGYGADSPLIEMTRDGTRFLAGPDALILRGPLTLQQQGARVSAELQVRKGDRIPMQLTWYPSHEQPPAGADVVAGAGGDGFVLAGLGGPLHLPGALARRRGALAADAQGADLFAHGRHRGGADDVAARGRSAACATGTIASAGCATPA